MSRELWISRDYDGAKGQTVYAYRKNLSGKGALNSKDRLAILALIDAVDTEKP